jgi:transposase
MPLAGHFTALAPHPTKDTAMTDWKLLDREQRGVQLAAMVRIVQKDGVWVVPSQSGDGTKYKVDPSEHSPYCNCPDHELTGHVCKHIYAVRIVRQRELFADGSETITESVTVTQSVQRKTYPQQWPAYNRAQTTEKETFQQLLAALCEGIQEPVQEGRGRRRIPLSDAVFACCFKVYSTLSGRRFISDLNDAHEKGHIGCVPHFNSIFNHLENEGMGDVLRDLIGRSSAPLSTIECDFACDSTGFMVSRFHRWYDEKYGKVREQHDWVKAHIAIGVRTHIVTAVEIHERNSNDSPIMPALLDETAKRFQISEVSGDKAYASENNFQAIAKHGATPYIPFKSWTTGAVGGLFQKAFHYFNLHRETFLEHYHKRSNVESAIMSIKTKFGDSVRSKTDRAMRNEVLCKILCHNICCLIAAMEEFGVPVDFATSPTVPMAKPQLARLG